jgi:hypothetical protein
MHPPFRDGHTQSVPPTSPNGNTRHGPIPQLGQVFIPRLVLNSGVFVPDSLLACRLVSNGAKLLWARLARYAGAKGLCFPLLSTLAADLGFSERQVQRYLAELVARGFLRARQRGFNKSNAYEFLWHPALVGSAGTVQTEQPTHNPLQESSSLCEVVEKPFRLFHPAKPQELAPVPPEHRTTTPASCRTTDLSSCVSTTDVSSCKNDFKNRIEMQAKPPRVVEVVEIPAGSVCQPPPEKEKRKPLTQEEAGVREQLERFQVELEITGTILPSTVRRVMVSVPTNRLTAALRFVAEKLYWRRRNGSSYRRHVGWGFVLRVLEQDFAVPSQETTPAEKSPAVPPVNPIREARACSAHRAVPSRSISARMSPARTRPPRWRGDRGGRRWETARGGAVANRQPKIGLY